MKKSFSQRCQQLSSLQRVAINAGGAYNYVPTAIMAILALLPSGGGVHWQDIPLNSGKTYFDFGALS